MKEEWKDIEGYEGLYQVSNLGRVRSLDRIIFRSNGKSLPCKSRVLKPLKDRNGYCRVDISKNESGRVISKRVFVHRLVAQAFIPNPDNLPEINHKDENKANNSVINLEYCNRSYNCSYGSWVEKHVGQRKKPVVSMINGFIVKKYDSINEASRDANVSSGSIMRVLQGKRKHCRGYEWQYA